MKPLPHIVFMYLGRRGISRFTLDLARCIRQLPGVNATFLVSRQNELFDEFSQLGAMLLGVDTFYVGAGAIGRVYRVPIICRNLMNIIAAERSAAAINLMPHVWTPLIAPVIRRSGCSYTTVVHDAAPHPGDPSSVVHGWLLRETRSADLVVTLNHHVTDQLLARRRLARDRVATLFHPDLQFGPLREPQPGWEPFRVLFFGRILPYKGLSTLVEAIELLGAQGVAVELGVYGDGDLSDVADRLKKLRSEVVNHWIDDGAVASVFARFHAIVVSHGEASQSGVVAAALGSGLPVIASPVGGLREQVKDGQNGILARTADAPGLAAAIQRLASDPKLYSELRQRVASDRGGRSMHRFAEQLCFLTLNRTYSSDVTRAG